MVSWRLCLFANGGGFDRFNVPQPITQETATETYRLQVFSPGDGVDAAVPSLGELPTGEKTKEDLLADSRKASLRLV